VAIVFDGVGKESGVYIGVLRAGGRGLESTMFGVGVGWGCPICDTHVVVLAVLPSHLDLAYRH